jgi:hypothetical protein
MIICAGGDGRCGSISDQSYSSLSANEGYHLEKKQAGS